MAPVIDLPAQAPGQADLAINPVQDQEAKVQRQGAAFAVPIDTETGDWEKTQLFSRRLDMGNPV